MPLLVTLVRHGNTDANNERWLQGHVDTNLNENGSSQAACCGKRLQNASYDHVYCSDLKRCKQTASAILAHHSPNISIDFIPILRERDFGRLSRQPLSYLLSESQRQGLSMDKFISNHDGESEFTFRSRVISAWDFIVRDAQERQYQSILVVTHGGPLKHLARYWIDNEFLVVNEELKVAPVAHGNTAVTRIDVTDKTIYEFNSTSHLKDQSANQPPPPAV
ncbi:histidine phosphatase superfamily [Parasitella parasitica]|nr:histidine phosphatase superfamily [Parasitella parasitica]